MKLLSQKELTKIRKERAKLVAASLNAGCEVSYKAWQRARNYLECVNGIWVVTL